jgi:hypothetical protein
MNDGSVDGSVVKLVPVYCMYISYVKASKAMNWKPCLHYIDEDDKLGIETSLNILYDHVNPMYSSANKSWLVEFNDNEYHVTIGGYIHNARDSNLDFIYNRYIKASDNEEYSDLVDHLYAWKGSRHGDMG